MYRDPARVRANIVKVRFNDYELDAVEAYVSMDGSERAAFIREAVLEKIQREMASGSFQLPPMQSEAPQLSLIH